MVIKNAASLEVLCLQCVCMQLKVCINKEYEKRRGGREHRGYPGLVVKWLQTFPQYFACRLSDIMWDEYKGWLQLKYGIMFSNYISKLIICSSDCLQFIQNKQHLSSFPVLNNIKYSGESSALIEFMKCFQLRNIKYLTCYNCDDELLQALPSLCSQLEQLHLDLPELVTDDGIASLCQCKNLKVFTYRELEEVDRGLSGVGILELLKQIEGLVKVSIHCHLQVKTYRDILHLVWCRAKRENQAKDAFPSAIREAQDLHSRLYGTVSLQLKPVTD